MIPQGRMHDATASRADRVARRHWQGSLKPDAVTTRSRKTAQYAIALAVIVVLVSAFALGALLEALT